ncbi:hypothetical protein K3495_g1817 [Podosphaera aphanis]|nr:hypothetical protein K3495_g1817 [Podosphaera aphanis]
MASSPPGSPLGRPPRSFSRISSASRGGGSRASDEGAKTSVKVVVRVRPSFKPTDPGLELIPPRFQRSMVHVTSNTSLVIDSPQGRRQFNFDRVFDESVGQAGIWDYLIESTNAFVQGYNVSMLAYGQSGAGKSYTMGTSGPPEQGNIDSMALYWKDLHSPITSLKADVISISGVIPRAATALFQQLEGQKPSNRHSISGIKTPTRYSLMSAPTGSPAMLGPKFKEKSWTLKVSYVEIYNEQLRDLLVPESTPLSERQNVVIREDTKGNILLTGLHQLEVNSVEDMMAALNFGSAIRQTDSTAINAKSSRSHAVFSLNLVQKSDCSSSPIKEKRFSVPLEAMAGPGSMTTLDSKFHFVDLAGSERLKNTGAQGERAREGISINAGLASLGKVISQLSSRHPGSHVSYRDSKLTRFLQDSLGGNAITYMIACITPAEFHLSETLNTVQYAQRARAIQSKPSIQHHVSDDTDKQELIDRLKSEVAFLRDKIRSTERGGDRRNNVVNAERSERLNDREVNLQNQLLDTQENYTALSQRHAKLISEMAKARDSEISEIKTVEDTLGNNATERLKRSNSFAEAVEHVVLEYEKTIQSLEQSLSVTRCSLSNTETILLEKETKCAHIETHNQQLQARLQKLLDRESSTENYLHGLEAKLDSHTSGEEKNSAIVVELRKEIARVRENEAACEDYISTLEERLAEADQDTELMQREIDRLEHVVERQRSLGKLDSLLYELDQINKYGKGEDDIQLANGPWKSHSSHNTPDQNISRVRSLKNVTVESENDDEFAVSNSQSAPTIETEGPVGLAESSNSATSSQSFSHGSFALPSSAQSKFVEDKLENVTQELIDLRVEHEYTVNEYDILSTKYEEALRTLAELQDTVDEVRHRGPRDSILSSLSQADTNRISFLANTRTNDLKNGTNLSSSRSLSSELTFAAGVVPSTTNSLNGDTGIKISDIDVLENDVSNDESAVREVKRLKKLYVEQENSQRLLAQKFVHLETEHLGALELVDQLKREVSKAQINHAESPRSNTALIRRKSSQSLMIIDKAHRAFASLRNIAAESFEANPDIMANFELNLNTAMHELHVRSERIQELEAEISAVKKEIETKMSIIAGLTRERSSLQSSPIDISVVSNMNDQLLQRENHFKEAHLSREQELLRELNALRASLDLKTTSDKGERKIQAKDEPENDHPEKDAELDDELTSLRDKHQAALTTFNAIEQKLLKTIADLESQIHDDSKDINHDSKLLSNMQTEVYEYKSALKVHSSRISDLENSHALVEEQLNEASKSRDIAQAEMENYQSLINRFEQQIAENNRAVELQRISHAKSLEDLEIQLRKEHESQLSELENSNQQTINRLQAELNDARNKLITIVDRIKTATGVDVGIDQLLDKIVVIIENQRSISDLTDFSSKLQVQVTELSELNNALTRELESIKENVKDLFLASVDGKNFNDSDILVTDQLAVLRKEIIELATKNDKNSRLVQELEDQLAANYDQHQVFNNRLSTLQSERAAQLEEANALTCRTQAELETIKEEYTNLKAKFEEINNSELPKLSIPNGHLQTAPSATSLPSPPPAIPLPPLPAAASNSPAGHGVVSQISGQTNRPTSKEIAVQQIHEDQEARIRTIEKHLTAEKQLTLTLEEALTDLENQSKKLKSDGETWKRLYCELELELKEIREKEKEKSSKAENESRWSLLQIEEERKKRRETEIAGAHLEQRMNAISKKKKKASLNCF